MLNKKQCVLCKANNSYPLFKFPKDSELMDLWREQTEVDKFHKDLRICSIHFDDDQWELQIKNDICVRTLKSNAVPTLYLKDAVPAHDDEAKVPQRSNRRAKKDRCAVCYVPLFVENSVSIFDPDDGYSHFGVALSHLLKMTSRAVLTRYACQICVEKIITCFATMVEVNISTALTNRRLKAQAMTVAITNEDDVSVDASHERAPCVLVLGAEDRVSLLKSEGVPEGSNGGFQQRCLKCDQIMDSRSNLTNHLMVHLFEDRFVSKWAETMTQTNEFDIDAGVQTDIISVDDEPQEPKPKKKRKRKKVVDEVKDEVTGPIKTENVSEAGETSDQFEIETLEEEYLSNDEGADPLKMEMKVSPMHSVTPKKNSSSTGLNVGGYCHLCGQYLKSSLAAHVALHKDNDEGPRNCDICNMEYKNSKSLSQHITRVHTKPRSNYKSCDVCGKLCGNLYQHRKNCLTTLARSQKPKRRVPRSTCGICGNAVSVFYFAKHLRLHEMEEDVAANGREALEKYLHQCSVCEKKVKNLPLHMKQIHNISVKKIIEKFDCEHCEESFPQRPLLVNHIVLRHGVHPRDLTDRSSSRKANWTCHVCGDVFDCYKKIKIHTREVHEGVGMNLSCEQCGKHYNTVEALREHINVKHIHYFPFRCAACERNFVTEKGFDDHVTTFCRASGAKKLKTQNQPMEPKFVVKAADNPKSEILVEYYNYNQPQDNDVEYYVNVQSVVNVQ